MFQSKTKGAQKWRVMGSCIPLLHYLAIYLLQLLLQHLAVQLTSLSGGNMLEKKRLDWLHRPTAMAILGVRIIFKNPFVKLKQYLCGCIKLL